MDVEESYLLLGGFFLLGAMWLIWTITVDA